MSIGRTEFTSGLRVVTERMPGVRSVTLGFWVLAGSRDEPPPISGLEPLPRAPAVQGDEDAERARHRRGVRRGGRRGERVHRQGVHGVLRAGARPGPADGGRLPLGHAAALGAAGGRPGRRTPGDPRGDQPARGRSGRPRPRPVHRDAVARSPARPADPRHQAEHRGGGARSGSALLPQALRRRGTWWSWPPGTSGTRSCSSWWASTWNRAPSAPRARAPGTFEPAGDAPTASGRSLVKKRTTEQAHICVGTSGLSRTDPDRFAFGVVNNALGGGMSLPAVPGGPGEAGARLQRLLVPRDVRRGGRVLRLRRHHARAREGGPRDHAGRARGRRREGPRPRRVRTRQGPHEGLAGPVAGGSGWTHVAPGQVRDRARRDPSP